MKIRFCVLTALITGLLTVAVMLGCIERRPKTKLDGDSPVSLELAEMVAEDQQMRTNENVDWAQVVETDRQHRERVYQLLAERAIMEPEDFYNAALVLQHADPASGRECYLLAHELALQAVRLGLEKARYLAASSLDRYLVFSGLPQKYGTQLNQDENGQWYLFPVDSTITDSERALWNVPSLDSLNQRIEDLNKGEGSE